MKPLTKFLLLLLFSYVWTAAPAQFAPAADTPAEPAAAEPLAEDGRSLTAEAAEASVEDSDETSAMELSGDEEPAQDSGALVEEDPAIAASAEEEFDPDEEISEDYPVPLPSDI